MLTFTVRMRFDEQDHAEITNALVKLTHGSRAEAGCVSYVCHWIAGDQCNVFIYEQYADEAALEVHRGTAHFKEYAVGVLYQRMRERAIENLTAVA